jgi:hypothetical protein
MFSHRIHNSCAAVLVFATAAAASTGGNQKANPAPECRPAGQVVQLPDLPEASGIAVSRSVSGRLWALNDSGEPVLLALDRNGAVTGRLTLTGATVEDWESLAVGPCPSGSCIYVADIGDNDAERERVTVYRVQEPSAGASSAAVQDVFHAKYPDGPQDAETILVTPGGEVFVVTKGDPAEIRLYRFPRDLRTDVTHQLERIGNARGPGTPSASERITDGDVSDDGSWVVLRTRKALTFHRASELLAGNWREAGRLDLGPVGEAQGEGVAIAADGTVYLAGEGGGKSRPGTFARVACSMKGDENSRR